MKVLRAPLASKVPGGTLSSARSIGVLKRCLKLLHPRGKPVGVLKIVVVLVIAKLVVNRIEGA